MHKTTTREKDAPVLSPLEDSLPLLMLSTFVALILR